jgi:hypothetical protein
MELMAAIQGLLAFKEPCEVEVTTDSEYVLQGITIWVHAWKRRHWWKKNRPVRNAGLWMELDGLVGLHLEMDQRARRARRQQPVRLAGPECRQNADQFVARRESARAAKVGLEQGLCSTEAAGQPL